MHVKSGWHPNKSWVVNAMLCSAAQQLLYNNGERAYLSVRVAVAHVATMLASELSMRT